MSQFLKDYVFDQIWCAPEQDRQYIVEPKRVSPRYGLKSSFTLLWNHIELPTPKDRYHVFFIGQVNPWVLGLLPSHRLWRTLADNMSELTMVAGMYNDRGTHIPRTKTWYMVTKNGALILAVEDWEHENVDIAHETLYLRVYTNAYFNSTRSAGRRIIQVEGEVVDKREDILRLQNRIETTANQAAYQYFLNGRLVNKLDLTNVKTGDYVETVHDASIKRYVDFNYKDLREFNSTLDKRSKYVLHFAPPKGGQLMIDYHDDVDFYLLSPDGSGYEGVYLYRNDPACVRQLTHRDYSVGVDTCTALFRANTDWSDIRTTKLRLYIRESGYSRPLVFENNRIHELYKLKTADLRRAMLGIDSTVPVWRADALESSGYTALMRMYSHQYNTDLAVSGLGYNAITRLLGMSPHRPALVTGKRMVVLPYGLINRSTGFEYGTDRKLDSWYSHDDALHYPVRKSTTELVETLAGYGTQLLDELYGYTQAPIDPKKEYRFYLCDIANGVVKNNWEDVTDSNYYIIKDGQIQWAIPNTKYPMIRSNGEFLAYQFELRAITNVLRFAIRQQAYRNDMIVTQNMQIPMEDLDVFLNGHALVEDIDYKVDFPEVTIISKKYIKGTIEDPQQVVVRFTGFCKKNTERKKDYDSGFVDHEMLSRNNIFNIHDDKVLRIIVDGKTYFRDEVKFDETAVPSELINALNGKPYQVRDVIVPIRGEVQQDTEVLRASSREIDKSVGDYLTIKIPPSHTDAPNTVQELHALYSPFLTAVITDLIRDVIDINEIFVHLNDEEVKALCKEHEHLLRFDPTQPANEIDGRYVIIHPTPYNTVLDVPVHKYQFIRRVIDIYCKDKVDISHFITISPL